MGNSSSSSTGTTGAHCPVWARQLTGDATTTVYSVHIQNKEKIPSILKANDRTSSASWQDVAAMIKRHENDAELGKFRKQLETDETHDRYKLMVAQQKKLREQQLPDPLFYEDGGVPLTHTARKFPFFYALYAAYMQHGELLLSPDDVWCAIQLSLSRYINEDPATAERLRSVFVDFQGRKKIEVQCTNLDWKGFTNEVTRVMASNMKKGIVDEVCPKFSTTGPFQELVSHTILMDCFQAYFDYVIRIGCGITKVHFLGTQEDWESLPKRLQTLRHYEGEGGSGKWARYVDRLVPVLKKLAETRTGKVDVRWWNGILDEKHATGYGMGKPAELTGWAMRFIYGLADKVEDINDIPNLYARTPVTMLYDDGREVQVYMYCGFDGLSVADVGGNRQVIRPHASFCVMPKACA